MRLSKNMIQAMALPIIILFLLPSIQIQAITNQPEQADYRSIYMTVEIKPDLPQPGRMMIIEIRVEDAKGPIDDAVIKVLITFANGRHNSFFGKSDYYGIITLSLKIPIGVPTGSGNLDVMARKGNMMIIQSLTFLVK